MSGSQESITGEGQSAEGSDNSPGGCQGLVASEGTFIGIVRPPCKGSQGGRPGLDPCKECFQEVPRRVG